MLSEFDLIKRYFTRGPTADARIGLGIGDDCALLQPGPGMRLAVSTDMLVEDRHFFAGADAISLGHKSLAVNLSDLAAMGATPLAFTLALALPKADPDWLEGFSAGLFSLADRHGCTLIGGDTTKGPLTICITVFGELPTDAGLLRSAARPGDDVWVSGTLGDARLALAAIRGELDPAEQAQARAPQGDLLSVHGNLLPVQGDLLSVQSNLLSVQGDPLSMQSNLLSVQGDPLSMQGNLLSVQADAGVHAELRLHRPTPRVALGIALRGVAHAAIDISDGLAGDLGHILKASGCGATLDVDALPAGAALQLQPQALRRAWTLSGGDDYELCFTAPAERRAAVLAAADAADTPVTRVGRIDADTGLRLYDTDGQALSLQPDSFDHFRSA